MKMAAMLDLCDLVNKATYRNVGGDRFDMVTVPPALLTMAQAALLLWREGLMIRQKDHVILFASDFIERNECLSIT